MIVHDARSRPKEHMIHGNLLCNAHVVQYIDGVNRWFIVDDVDMLEDDLQLLKGLFYADGEGLPRLRIDELCWPLTGILVTMQLDTGILISNYKQVCVAQSDISHLAIHDAPL